MIHESCYWKDDLLDLAFNLKDKYSGLGVGCDEKQLVNLEKDIMLGAYSIRKLVESGKISDKIANTKVNVFVYKAKKKVHRMDWFEINENYENTYKRINIGLRYICNTIIHSYCFAPGFDKRDKLKYLYFNSAKQKNIEIYSISLECLAEVLERVGKDYPNQVIFKYNEIKGDYELNAQTIRC